MMVAALVAVAVPGCAARGGSDAPGSCSGDVPQLPSTWSTARGAILGQVADHAGRPIAGAAVKLQSVGGASARTAPAGSFSASDGTFMLRHVGPGRYRVQVWALGFAAVQSAVEVRSGGADTVRIRLPDTSGCQSSR